MSGILDWAIPPHQWVMSNYVLDSYPAGLSATCAKCKKSTSWYDGSPMESPRTACSGENDGS